MPHANVDLDDLVVREARRIQSHGRVDLDMSNVSAALVLGDSAQLTRALRNLLDNAERHAASQITLSLGEVNGQAVLTITDDGPGISAENAERVFERFGRLDEARSSETGGTGLGLAIARDIVERHDGSIQLTRIDGPGASFEVRLPLAD
jgi:signal transduction histidine kinase